MPQSKELNGTALASVAAGSLFIYAGIKGFSVLQALRNIIAGQPPKSGQQSAGLTSQTGGSQAGGINSSGGPSPKGSYTADGLRKLWVQVGGSPAGANNAACHAMQESAGNPGVTSSNPDGGTNVGLWQLDTPGGVGAGYTIDQLKNPVINARITVRATNNGRDWSNWATPGC